MAVFGAFLEPRSDDKVLGLVLAHGGHLTHGSPVNFSGKWFNFVGYEVDPATETIDMDRVRELARRAPAEDHPRRVHRVPARDRLRGVPADRRRGRRASSWSTRRTSSGWCAGGAYPIAGARTPTS